MTEKDAAVESPGAWLALELSADPSSVALRLGTRIHEREFSGERGRALLLEIDALLAEHGLEATQLAGLLVGIGPGSYTGLRIACAASRSLSFALRIPARGLSSFEAVAWQAPQQEEVHLLLDAYRREVYHAAYRREATQLIELQAPHIVPRAETRAWVPEHANLIGDPSLCEHETRALSTQVLPKATDLFALHELRNRSRSENSPAAEMAPEPMYLRAAR